jgi:hypothetical protein
MAATNTTPLVRQQSQEPQMMFSNSTKARLMGSSPGLWLRSPLRADQQACSARKPRQPNTRPVWIGLSSAAGWGFTRAEPPSGSREAAFGASETGQDEGAVPVLASPAPGPFL